MKKALIIFVLIFGLKTEAQINNSKEAPENLAMHNVGFSTLLVHCHEDGLRLYHIK
jgi:hypothetical protein